jgi:hypothetical protein
MTNPRKTGYCAVCEYIKTHKRACINKKLLEGASYRSIAIETGLDQRTIAKHAKAGHGMKPVIAQAGRTKAVKEGLELVKCAKEIYDDCKDNAAKAKEKAESSRDFRDASGCWDAATRALSVLKVGSPNDHDETESDGYIDAMRANANNDWKEARAIQVAATEPKTEDGSELVDE